MSDENEIINDFLDTPVFFSYEEVDEMNTREREEYEKRYKKWPPPYPPSMTKREMYQYAEKIRDSVLLQHPAGKSEKGRLEAFVIAGRMLFGYEFGG